MGYIAIGLGGGQEGALVEFGENLLALAQLYFRMLAHVQY